MMNPGSPVTFFVWTWYGLLWTKVMIMKKNLRKPEMEIAATLISVPDTSAQWKSMEADN
jgi:hypothetical protein